MKRTLHPLAAASLLGILFFVEIGVYDLVASVPHFAFAEWGIEWFKDIFNGRLTPHFYYVSLSALLLTITNHLLLRQIFQIRTDSKGFAFGPAYGVQSETPTTWSLIQVGLIFLGVCFAFYILFLAFGGWFFSGEWDMQFG